MNLLNLMPHLIISGIFSKSGLSRPFTGQGDNMEPWEKPCVCEKCDSIIKDTASINMDVVTRPLPLKAQLTELVTVCSEGWLLANKLKSLMFRERIQSLKNVEWLTTKHVMGFPHAGHLESWDPAKPIEPVLEKDSIVFQTAAIFLTQTLDDENRRQPELSRNISEVLKKVYDILCQLKGIDTSQGYYFAGNVTSDVIPNGVQNPASIAVLFFRDYIIFRDLEGILANRKQVYNEMDKNL